MLSIDFIKENLELVKDACVQKKREVDFDRIIELDFQRREKVRMAQILQEERNILTKSRPDELGIARGKTLKEVLSSLSEAITKIEVDLEKLLLTVPNVPLPEAPRGKNEDDNVEIFRSGDVVEHSFPSKDHVELLKIIDGAELENGSKVSGYRGYFLKGQLARLHLAILLNAMDLVAKKGYTELIAPAIVKGFTLYGNGQFPWGESEVYKLGEDDSYLAGSAEVAVTALHSDQILNESDLPLKYVALSPCFRKEAGSYGKDTKGLYRVHEFWKVEQVILAKADLDEAKQLHLELQNNIEEILKSMDLPFRRLLMCTGDMGEPQIFKYDTEVYLPGSKKWAELGSNSIMGDFQARRLKLRYKDKNGEVKYCYTLNNTALASPRSLVAMLEIHQQEDGSVNIPKNLTNFGAPISLNPKK